MEKHIAKCNGMQSLREAAECSEPLRSEWVSAVNSLQTLVAGRFQRLALKEERILTMEPMTTDSIRELQECLTTLFPGINLEKLTKKGLKKLTVYRDWVEKHCRERTYTFQIKKCHDSSCCSPFTLSADECVWLPDPELSMASGSDTPHYKKITESYGTETTEKDKPSWKPLQKVKSKVQREIKVIDLDPVLCAAPSKDASVYTVQCAKSTVVCIECRKPRLIYSKHRLTDRQRIALSMLLSEVEFSCGDQLTTPGHSLHNTIYVRVPMGCADAIEMQYYATGFGRMDICCYCCQEDVPTDGVLQKKFKTVLPICDSCRRSGLPAVYQRPYGKAE